MSRWRSRSWPAPTSRDPDSVPIEGGTRASPRPHKVAYSPRFGLDVPVDFDVAAATELAVEALAAAGVAVARRDPVWPAAATESALMPLQQAGLAALYGERFRREPEIFDPDIGAQIERGLGLAGTDVAHALALGAEVARSLAGFLAEVDLLIGPTTPCVAWPLGAARPRRSAGSRSAPGATGVHAAVQPCQGAGALAALWPRAGSPAGRAADHRQARPRPARARFRRPGRGRAGNGDRRPALGIRVTAPMRILLLNPNTSVGVTDRMSAVARAIAAPSTEIVPLTAPRGDCPGYGGHPVGDADAGVRISAADRIGAVARMRILLLNPNTSVGVTDRMSAVARAIAARRGQRDDLGRRRGDCPGYGGHPVR